MGEISRPPVLWTHSKGNPSPGEVQNEEEDPDAYDDEAPVASTKATPVNPGSVPPSVPPRVEGPSAAEPRPVATTPRDPEPTGASPEVASSGAAASTPAVTASSDSLSGSLWVYYQHLLIKEWFPWGV